ncbi:NACHT domain-containing protein [Halomonas aestuarii]|uniref:NACHT domain-containing protein n=1 Tax=Halomonas aestuarii TaxID=1897729 RepID=UPI0009F99F28|nr:NACHT domain-containing protein [Halomonas aestuarii]
MALETLTAKKAIELSVPVANRIYRRFVSPYVEKKILHLMKSKDAYRKFKSGAEGYLANIAGQCSVINTIAFQNAPKKLSDLYMPLTVVDYSDGKEIVVEDGRDVFDMGDRLLLVDNAGMGKTTLSKKVVVNVVEHEIGIPIFFEMRKLSEESLVSQIGNKLGIREDVCVSVLKELPLICVFDGVDETPDKLQAKAVDDINDFSNSFPESKIIVTSRNETYLPEFHSFSRLSVRSLKREEAFELIKKYDPEEVFFHKLVRDINSSGREGVHEFLTTPLYVSLLFCAYRHKSVVPKKRSLFYSQVYEALFESHDLSKEVGFIREKYSNLDSVNFHAVLRRLGFWCLKNEGRLNFRKDELEITLKEIIDEMAEISVSPSDFVKDLVSTVPIFVKEGGVIGWSHKSLMEYFAAMFICNDVKSRQAELLEKIYDADKGGKFLNVIDLCSDIDYSAFKFSIAKRVFEDFLKHCEKSCSEIKNKRISRDVIKARKGLSFSNDVEFSFCYMRNESDRNWIREQIQPFIDGDFTKDVMMSGLSYDGKSVPVFFYYKQGVARKVFPVIKKVNPELFVEVDDSFDALAKDLLKSTIKRRKVYEVVDDPGHLINNSANFDTVNRLLYLNSPYALDEDEVKKELDVMSKDESNGVGALLEGF